MSLVPSFDEVKSVAFQLGWDDAGLTTPEIPQPDIDAYQEWLSNGQHGQLKYMENDLRTAPERLLPGAKSAILFVSNYKQSKLPFNAPTEGLVASYARGRDYHNVHRNRLKQFIRWLEERTGIRDCAIGFSDSKPILEKALFVKSGLGWFGKNTLLIHRRFGTFILLSGVLSTLEFSHAEPRSTREMRCGTCNRCINACPTQAIISPYHLDAAKCLSYHLIESKEPIPPEIAKKNPGYAFGCDICQDVCPHNVKSPISQAQDFSPSKGIGGYLNLDLLQTSPSLDGTPLKRRKIEGLVHNMQSIIKNQPS